MENNTYNIYLFKALDAYPYDLEGTMEALTYALSYTPNCAQALLLMAKLHSEQLRDYNGAKFYFEKALANDINFVEIYPAYARSLLQNDDFAEAQKLIDFALTIKGIDKASIYLIQGQLHENFEAFDKAEEALREAKRFGLNNSFIEFVNDEIARIEKKRKVMKGKLKKEEESLPKEKVKEKNSNSWFKDRLNGLL